MTDKYIVKVRMLGACVIITVPAGVREITGIESGDYVYVETTGKRGFTVTKGAVPAKKAPAKAAKKVVAKKKIAAPKKKVAVPASKKKTAPKLAPKKIVAKPSVKKKIVVPKPAPVDLPIESISAQAEGVR